MVHLPNWLPCIGIIGAHMKWSLYDHLQYHYWDGFLKKSIKSTSDLKHCKGNGCQGD